MSIETRAIELLVTDDVFFSQIKTRPSDLRFGNWLFSAPPKLQSAKGPPRNFGTTMITNTVLSKVEDHIERKCTGTIN